MHNITISVSLSICSQSWNLTVPISYPAHKSFSTHQPSSASLLNIIFFPDANSFHHFAKLLSALQSTQPQLMVSPAAAAVSPLPPILEAQMAGAFPSFQAWWKNYNSFLVLPVTWARRTSLAELLVNVKNKQANKQHFTVLVLSMLGRRSRLSW